MLLNISSIIFVFPSFITFWDQNIRFYFSILLFMVSENQESFFYILLL